jgi:ABC-type polar amino acid transport system ATPase subunit
MNAVLRVDGLCVTRDTRRILHDITFSAAAGEVVALMGTSGSGKTTVLRVVAGLDSHERGQVTSPKVGMVFQFHNLFEHLSARDNVALAPIHVQRVDRRDAEARADALLTQLGVGHRTKALPRELSGGEAQRVAIARALAMDPPLLLLDEPTASLDPARSSELGRELRRLASAGRALIVASHDDDFVRECASRVLVLSGGEVVEQGDPREVLVNPRHAATQHLLHRDRGAIS